MPEERRVFRTSRWLLILLGGAFVGCLVGGVGLLWSEGTTLTALALVGLSVLFLVGFIESVITRVVLEPEQLEIVSNFRRSVISRSEFVRAVAEKGVPIALERTSGTWVKLPDTVAGPHINTVRAWLKRPVLAE